jgi:hypothetical protein
MPPKETTRPPAKVSPAAPVPPKESTPAMDTAATTCEDGTAMATRPFNLGDHPASCFRGGSIVACRQFLQGRQRRAPHGNDRLAGRFADHVMAVRYLGQQGIHPGLDLLVWFRRLLLGGRLFLFFFRFLGKCLIAPGQSNAGRERQ